MSEVLEKFAGSSGTDVTLTTTAETAIISSDPVRLPVATGRVLVRAWAQLTLGTACTAVTPRIRRGVGVAGALVGEGNAEQIKTVAGSTEPFYLEAVEQRAGEDAVQYTFTLQQTGATGNGTALQYAIEVEVMNG
jgi:hypothetical protein